MSAESGQLERIERELAAVREAVERLVKRPEPGSLTFAGAAVALGVSRKTVQRMVATKQLHPVTIGQLPRIPRSEVQRLLTPGRMTPSMPEHGQRKPARVLRRRGGAAAQRAELAKLEAAQRRRRRPPATS